jgi:tripartite-type tricarboxylate transporter receptor subunit TctC
MLSRRRVISAAVGVSAAGCFPATSFAQAYPARPVRLLVGTPAGGVNDQVMRTAAVDAERKLGQPVVVENKSGASGVLSFLAIRSAAPDGYTIGVATPALWRQPILEEVAYDPLKDFTYIINLSESVFGVVVRESSPLKTWADLLAFGRANPDKVSYGAPPGPNQTSHILMEGVARHEHLNWTPVGYRGSSESITALLGGHITFSVEPLVSVGEMVRAGKARYLAIAGAERLKNWPNVPTLKELGYPVFTVDTPAGLVGPANMAPDTVKILHDAFKFALDQPGVAGLLDRSDQAVRYMGTTEFKNYVARAAQEQRELLRKYGMAKKG